MLKIVIVALASAVASLVNIPVGDSGFRISLGIVVMVAAIIALKIRPVIWTSFITGMAVCLMRILVASLGGTMTPALAGNFLLEVFFYLSYGLFYLLQVVRNRAIYKIPLVVSLVICDAGANAVEYFLRTLFASEVWQNTSLTAILLAAFVRSVVIVLFVWAFETWVLRKTPDQSRG
ncbi:MAG TPA: hypothetical protein GXZ64_00305 [Clostridiaceae bacterium]|nr:hypothetical protein [Clostridiaceae bacterium]